MAKAPIVKATVTKDTFTGVEVRVMAHVVPVLAQIHGDEHVTGIEATGDYVEVDPSEEFNRLTAVYGFESESGQSFVQLVYGSKMTRGVENAAAKGLELLGLEKKKKAPAKKAEA